MFKPSPKKKTSIDIIPMIDVIFFLLVFFMLFTSFRTNPYGMEMQLPRAVTATEETEEHLVINITEDGDFYLQDQQLSLPRIQELVSEEVAEDETLTVIINADRASRYEFIFQVMDVLRQTGVYNIFLAAEREQPEDL